MTAQEQRVNVRPGQRLIVTVHGLPGWSRWSAARGAILFAGRIIGVEIVLLSGTFPVGRPR